MSTRVDVLDRELELARQWVAAVADRLDLPQNGRLALTCLEATLQALRDHLSPEQVARLAQHLPIPLKGAYYEGWRPSAAWPAADRQEFLQRIAANKLKNRDIGVQRGVKAALEVIAQSVPAADMAEFAAELPDDLRSLWPQQPSPLPERSASGRPSALR